MEEHILCTIDVVALYPNISHEKGMASFRKFLNAKTEKKVTTETLVELSEIVLKNNIFQFNKKTWGLAIGTKFAPPYAIIFMADLGEKILEDNELQPHWAADILMIYFLSGNMEKIL